TEGFLKVLFKLFGGANEAEKPIGFQKIAKVLANYSKESLDHDKSQRHAVVGKLTLLFSNMNSSEESDEEIDEEGKKFVNFDEFQAGLQKVAKDLVEEYVTPHWMKLSDRITKR